MAGRAAVGSALDLDLHADVGQRALARLGAGIAIEQSADDALLEAEFLKPLV